MLKHTTNTCLLHRKWYRINQWMFLWRSTSCTTEFRQKNTNKKENITVQKPGNSTYLIHEEDASANLNNAVSTPNMAFSSLLFLYSNSSSEGLCPSWPLLYKYLWFQKSLEMPRKQDCRWCALCTVHRLYQNGLEFQGNTVTCTCTNVTSFMPEPEK